MRLWSFLTCGPLPLHPPDPDPALDDVLFCLSFEGLQPRSLCIIPYVLEVFEIPSPNALPGTGNSVLLVKRKQRLGGRKEGRGQKEEREERAEDRPESGTQKRVKVKANEEVTGWGDY